MSTTCEKCQGQGLIGSGDNPHLLEGRRVTCPDCGGTGSIADATDVPVSSSTGDTVVDNTTESTPGAGGILKKIFG